MNYEAATAQAGKGTLALCPIAPRVPHVVARRQPTSTRVPGGGPVTTTAAAARLVEEEARRACCGRALS